MNSKHIFLLSIFILVILPIDALAQQTRTLNDPSNTDPNSKDFQLTVCDGPTLPTELRETAKSELQKKGYNRDYIACDFNGFILQVQHVIDIAIIIGVLVAIVGFSYAGYLYVTGVEKNISRAKDIFPKILLGFIIMLSAWFIVYQILSWLTGEGSGFQKLLGNP